MSKIGNIFEGFSNLVFKSPEIEKLAEKRAEICYGCEHRAGNNALSAVCGRCGCFIKAKIRSRYEVCPVQKW